jgi:hypothetical protein
MWHSSCHCCSDTHSSAANDVATSSMSLTPVQQGGGSGVQRDVERVDSFELGVEEQQDALAIQSSFAVAHASSIIASVGTQSSASSTQVIPHSSNIIAQPLSTGVVPRLARHSFMGHGDEYLHADDLKRVLGFCARSLVSSSSAQCTGLQMQEQGMRSPMLEALGRDQFVPSASSLGYSSESGWIWGCLSVV